MLGSVIMVNWWKGGWGNTQKISFSFQYQCVPNINKDYNQTWLPLSVRDLQDFQLFVQTDHLVRIEKVLKLNCSVHHHQHFQGQCTLKSDPNKGQSNIFQITFRKGNLKDANLTFFLIYFEINDTKIPLADLGPEAQKLPGNFAHSGVSIWAAYIGRVERKHHVNAGRDAGRMTNKLMWSWFFWNW